MGSETDALKQYSPAIDGIRTAAVAATFVYHSDMGLEGGFLGVSQFFTLSGFLITSILLRSGAFDDQTRLVPFWARRYRRLLPASLLTLAAVVVVSAAVATEQQLDDLPGQTFAALAQVANWFFLLSDASYVDLFQAPSPIQHYWSLAIEEQFYLVMPLLLLGAYRLTRSLRMVTAMFAVAVVASSATMWVLFDRGASIDRLYYGTDTRATEILVGCILALVLHQRPLQLGIRGRAVVGGIGCIAAVMTVWAWFSVSLVQSSLYKGGFLLYSLASAALILTAVAGAGPVAWLLSRRPLPAIGRISYGVYLIHWPVILWLDDDRVGVGGWTLFAIQAGVTIALAMFSAHFVENPIRYGQRRAGDYRLPIGLATSALVIAAGVFVVGQRSVETDLAGLGEGTTDAPISVSDGLLDVLVIADDEGAGFATELADREGNDLHVVIADPFSCEPADGESGATTVCANWEETWAPLVDEIDPDIVFFHVSEWDADQIASLADTTDLEAQTEWALGELRLLLEVLTGGGASVAWGVTPSDVIRSETQPFTRAMTRLTSEDPRARRLGIVTDPDETIEDLELYRRTIDADLPRVLVVGDSVSRTIGYGLERWTAATGEYLVWSAGTEGCGIATEGMVSDASGREEPAPQICPAVAAAWADQIDEFEPDVVVVASTAADFRRRRLPDWDEMQIPGDADFDDYLVAEYVDAYDTLSAEGAEVVWIRPACALDIFEQLTEPDGSGALDSERVTHVNEVILERLAQERPGVRLFDLFSLLCPDGEFVEDIGGVENIRPDGAHFSPEGSLWLAENHGTAIIERTTG